MRLALFGGTFDPIHSAHLTVAREAADQFELTRVLFVPAAHPPHKDGLAAAPYEDRYRMTELACQDDARFVASRLEAGDEKSYSILTIERVRAAEPDLETLYFLIGADAFAEIKSWYRWQDVLRLTDFIVVTRPGHVYEAPAEARVHRLNTLALPVSSSEIRQQLARGGISGKLPAAVSDYIAARRLYHS